MLFGLGHVLSIIVSNEYAVPLGPAPAMVSDCRADLKSATMTSVVVDFEEVISSLLR